MIRPLSTMPRDGVTFLLALYLGTLAAEPLPLNQTPKPELVEIKEEP